ncbi:MAG: TetR/AcrR family transcriptional regulator [Kofleriaceae bacterium]
MGTADRIERERQQKRTAILEAARELFVERGVEAVTLREVAQKIEYSTTAIYVHFGDKAALVAAMIEEDFAAFSKGLEAAASIVDPVERIVALQTAYIDFALSKPHHYQMLFLTPPRGAEKIKDSTSPAGIQGYRVLLAAIEECLHTKRLRAELSDAAVLTQTVWATVHGMVSLRIVLGHQPAFHWADLATLADTVLATTVRGMLREPDDIDRYRSDKPKKRKKR